MLRGENALIFAYGVTNSGKTYSIMGTKKQPGLLPRTLDVIFNSIDGFLSDSKVKPCMHSLVQTYIHDEEENRNIFDNPNMEVSKMISILSLPFFIFIYLYTRKRFGKTGTLPRFRLNKTLNMVSGYPLLKSIQKKFMISWFDLIIYPRDRLYH